MDYRGNSKNIGYKTDICVVGGGLAGISAALAAARAGSKVVLVQDRPVLGGNSSSEIRMWACGAHGFRETGIIEELLLENIRYNPRRNFHIWDGILFNKVKSEPNITLVLNCSCFDAISDNNTIKSIKGWQLTTYTFITVEATQFIDCSGDSILALLTDANYTYGREASALYGESIAPKEKDTKTMGHSLLLQFKESKDKVPHKPFPWSRKIYKEELYKRKTTMDCNFWWIELGGEQDTIKDTEIIRDDLFKLMYGVFDYVKEEKGNENLELNFAGMLPGKRESLRYIGDHMLTQNDVRNEGKFDDIIAFGGWTMDDHNPKGFENEMEPTIFHEAPSPFGIPYRCIYSKNINNLFFAGRNISATHSAMSATRVMATCAILGQAAGEAAAMACQYMISPRDVYNNHINELKQRLMFNDATLPFNSRKLPKITTDSNINISKESKEILLNGLERDMDKTKNHIEINLNNPLTIKLKEETKLSYIRILFDSDLSRKSVTDHPHRQRVPMRSYYPLDIKDDHFPKTMVSDFDIQFYDDNKNCIYSITEKENIKRCYVKTLNISSSEIHFIPKNTYGANEAKLFSIEVG